MPSATSRVLTVRMPNDCADLVEEYAAAQGEYVSHVIRRAVLREIRAVREAVSQPPRVTA